MGAKVLSFDLSKKPSKIGAPPTGKVLSVAETAVVISFDNLSSAIHELRLCRQAVREVEKLNFIRRDIGDEPIFYSEEEWAKKVYEATRGWLWGHPSQDQLIAYHKGEPIEY